MKIYFMAPMRGKVTSEEYFKKIYDAIEKLGYTLLDKYLLKNSMADHYKRFEERGDEYYHEFYEKTISYIKQADINIFECSSPSLGLGYQIEKSLQFNKPTIVLYLEGHVPHFLVGVDEDKLVIKVINEKNLLETLTSAINEARNKADKRFNFFISPALLTYLENESRNQNITKSTFIRSLILEHKRKNAKKS